MSTDKSRTPDVTIIKSQNHFPVIGIGASAGGLDAFKKLLKAIPDNSGMAFVLVQHLDPKHESLLPELLQKVTKIPVLEISDDMKVQPDHIYIIPSNKIMVANDGVLLLSPRTANKYEQNLPIDLFFTSLAEVHQSHSIGIVLSGTASDGTKGLKAIKDCGGITFAQDEDSAAYDGMPHNAIQAGVVDFILPPEQIPQKLLEIIKITNNHGGQAESLQEPEIDVYKQILALLRIRKGTDFTYYKQTTIRRRIFRRMALNRNEKPAGYLDYLRENKKEQDVLYQDLLIPVTSFFRDAKTFDHLCESIFPQILKNKKDGQPIRVWVAGCSTGQEVYSVAICLKEYLGDQRERVQIFATDISEPAIAKARTGIYEKSETEGLSAQRLQEYFTKSNGTYQVNKSIRDLCVFAAQNFLIDPPFGNIDFISCRNVLIYMEPYLQKKALITFHYALNPKGFLLLGKSETISSVPELFASAVKNDKLFLRKDAQGRFMPVASLRNEQNLRYVDNNVKSETTRNDFQKTADDIMLSKYTPAGVVVNEEMDIVHFRGKTGAYLEQFPGRPSHNLLKMARNGLAFELRNILHKAKKGKTTVKKENIPLEVNGNLRNITIEALPLPDTIEPHYLVLFYEGAISNQLSAISKKGGQNERSRNAKSDDKDSRIAQLEKELAQLRDDIRSITEDQEAVNEELQSANEELLSGSEELQSLNEELETGKEELQSTNEELTVVNQEMISLNEQVTEARDYSEAIITTVREPLLVLDRNLRIKSANSAFYKTFQVNELETEGRLVYHLGDNQWNIPELRTLLEDILPKKTLFVDFEVSHRFQQIGERVMLLNAREIRREITEEKLILLAIEDVTEVRQKAAELLAIEKKYLSRFQNLMMQTPMGIVVFRGNNYTVELANNLALGILIKDKSFIGKPFFETMPEVEEQIKPILDKVMQSGIPFHTNELPVAIFRNGKNETGFFNFVYEPIREDDKTISGIITAVTEVTEQVLARKKVEESEVQFSALANNIHDLAWMANEDGWIYWYNNRWFEYTGTSLTEMEGWGWQTVHDSEQLPLVLELWHESIRTGKTFEMTFPLRGADHTFRSFLTRVEPMRNGEGKITRWVGTNTDITEQIETQSLLEYRKALLEAHNEASVDGLLLVDSQGKIISYNQRFREIWNMPQSLVDEKNDEKALAFAKSQLIHPEQFIEKVEYLYANPKEISIDELEYLDGKIVERHGYPVVAPDGNYYAWSWKFRDITEAKKAETALRLSEQNFRQLAELIPEKVSHADAQGNITYYNQSWLTYTGYNFVELKNCGSEKIIHQDDLEELTNRWQHSIDTGDNFEMELRIKDVNGDYKWHLNRSVPVKDDAGNIKRWIATTTEIQKIKQEEQRKTDFLKMVSHELKTPVTSIRGYVQFLLKMLSEEQEKQLLPLPLRSSLGRIDSQVGRLSRLITELLDLSRIEESKLELRNELFNLNDLLHESVEDIHFSTPDYDVFISGEERFSVLGDRDRIGQVIINFITNAIKYSPNNHTIEVQIYEAAKNHVSLSVKDYGIGIDQKYQQKIFERFYRIEGKNEQRYGGFGIGLFVAAEIIKRHKGYLTVESEKGKGSVFTFTLPFVSE